ncbi:polyprenyl synthetase family protein [Pelagicoccus sp. SDUM812003]|uniref:polyprenyl synthetase family protein n=1 Tax=Pelagicoccus sp. SDUM812003 TaxID=3041267 RepID=UPI00280EE9BE|nr:polyprenyl synthetase family protein [Pelagicoccus sp. SDUM812003]MDQ8202250.1 polyprenyl synthetase family protein [Pelagicoccus sp. SDUM812003]
MPFQTLTQLKALLPDLSRSERHLRDALLYVLETQGSLSRARLAYSVGCELELPEHRRICLAAGIEFFHVASLLLDDLPCMDDADTRRGRMCAHRRFGESSAILAALALINRAYALLFESFVGLEHASLREANHLADDCLGLAGIVNGQALDLNFQDGSRDADAVVRVALLKTGALFRLCLVLPAIVGNASRYEKMHLSRLADVWGVAYQVADDLKDVLQGALVTGKNVQQDETLGRPNLAVLLGVEKATGELGRLLGEADGIVRALSDSEADRWVGIALFQKEFLTKVEPLLAKQEVA